ncbi:MAG: hypothetical protein AAGI38_25305, partial [Bacteroidota bacterium]
FWCPRIAAVITSSGSAKNFSSKAPRSGVNREMTSSKQVLLGVDYFSVNFSKDALEGLYIIRAEVLDWKNQTRTTLSQALLLSNFVYEPFFEEKETFFAWRNQYYRNPRPELALDAFMFHAQNGTVANQSEFWAHFAFFLEIFRQNDFLIPELIQRYAELSLQGKIHSIYLLRYLEHPLIRPFLASLDGPEGETYAHLLENNFLKPNYPVETQDQLAMAWAAFLATGRFEPIENIVQSLNFVTYKGAIAQYRAAPDLQAQKRESARYEALYQATFQTLVANCREHPLIEAYCRYMLLKEDLNPEVHDELIEVFKRI